MIAVNPSASLRAGLQVRPALPADHQQIADLTLFESHVHRHLDWRAPLEWLGHSPYWVLEERGRITAALACPPDPDSIAWIRLFAFASHLSGPEAWSPLWTAARHELSERGNATVAAIPVQRWFDPILAESGFNFTQHIVMLEWNDQPAKQAAISPDITIRAMNPEDLPRVVDTDAAAFVPLWQNSLNALSKSYSQAIYASVAENASGVIGYQLSTGNSIGTHLARLAVRPDAQGKDVGAALVSDLICQMRARGIVRISVNTQADNAVSLALYHKLGFHRTGEQYPVYTYRVE
ncbi:MAG: GNAT family N-acetyltransferase [Chloroflexi bacterium]|nr:GNAT family N-acetyltransferase [Chloroflexota bacterium]